MPFLILNSKCFFSTSISNKEMNSIANAKSAKDIITIWDKIRDFFCGTDKVKAKKLLFTLMNETSSNEEKLNAFLKLRNLCTEAYKNNFIINNMNYLDMENLDNIEDRNSQYLVLSIKNNELDLNITISNNQIKNQHSDKKNNKEKLIEYIEDNFITTGKLKINDLLLSDICRANYNIIHNGKSYCFRVGDNIIDKKETVERLLSTINPHQNKWINMLCSQLLITGAINCANNYHDKNKFVSFGNDFNYLCYLDFISEEAILVNVDFFNVNDKAMMSMLPELKDAYKEVCFKGSFLVTSQDLLVLNSQYFGDNKEIFLTD